MHQCLKQPNQFGISQCLSTLVCKMRRAGLPFWIWLAAVLLGPFIPFFTAPLGAIAFHEPSSSYPGSDWRGLQAMIYFGLPAWALMITIVSFWLASRIKKDVPEAAPDVTGSGCLMSVLGLIASGVWALAACGVISAFS
jgi:hypothetical protein